MERFNDRGSSHSALCHQEAGQETKVVFGPEQEEWKAAILAELQSFAKLGVYEVATRAEVGASEGKRFFLDDLCWW